MRLFVPLILLLAVLIVPSGVTASTGGGASYAPPSATNTRCLSPDSEGKCPIGTQVRIGGDNLENVTAVVFLGRKKTAADDRRALPAKTSSHRVLVTVPPSARTGKLIVETEDAETRAPKLAVAESTPLASDLPDAPEGIFPVVGKHTYGDGFGAGRGHQGADIFAKCGRRIVAPLGGEVQLSKWHDRAGNYVVVSADDGQSHVFMHLQQKSTLQKGDRIEQGHQIGLMGDTGRASGCHLHFELWTAPGWYEGGEAIDPMPTLKRWDKNST